MFVCSSDTRILHTDERSSWTDLEWSLQHLHEEFIKNRTIRYLNEQQRINTASIPRRPPL